MTSKGYKLSDEHKIKISLACIGRIPPNKGKHHTKNAKKKMQLARLGTHHSEEVKKKISLNHVGMHGKLHSNETKKRISLAHIGKHITEKTKQKMKLACLQRTFSFKNTSIEIKLQNALIENHIVFKKHACFIGRPDIFIEPNICIFADGCYWHGCEQCMDRNKFEGWLKARKIKDLLVTQKLQNDNYIVLRFWEHEINDNLENVTQMILNQITSTIITSDINVVDEI